MKKKTNRGFTLLLAALVSSIVLSLGASIFVIAKKELTLSSLGRDSQYAFYSADQAAECALYWDSPPRNYFGTSTPPVYVAPNDPLCDGQHWKDPATGNAAPGGTGRPAAPATYPYTMTFQYSPVMGGISYCANVSVVKCDGPISGTGACTHAVPAVIHTTIHADGYSAACGTLTTNPRVLQRSVELHY